MGMNDKLRWSMITMVEIHGTEEYSKMLKKYKEVEGRPPKPTSYRRYVPHIFLIAEAEEKNPLHCTIKCPFSFP